MAAKKILMLVGDFVEDYEVMVPFQAVADGRPPRRCSLSGQIEAALVCKQPSMTLRVTKPIAKSRATTSH